MNWRDNLRDFTSKLEHPAWGPAHGKRVYDLAVKLAEGCAPVDTEALWAAACLHDMGAFAPYRAPGVDHAQRSAELAGAVLLDAGFPTERIPLVLAIIKGHMFDQEPGSQLEAVVFHDADTLDFMGAIGIARIVSIVGLDDWTPTLAKAIDLIDRFSRELPDRLFTAAAREIGRVRRTEMESFLSALRQEADGLRDL